MINLSGIANFPKILFQPKLVVPKVTVANFNEINFEHLKKVHGIKCIVLDKDNCISKDKDNRVYGSYLRQNWVNGMLKWYDMSNVAVVSNSIGSSDDTAEFADAKLFQKNYKEDMEALKKEKLIDENFVVKELNVITHNHKKPGCHEMISNYFIKEKKLCDHPSEIAIIGDRLFTDVLMGNIMEAFPVYLRVGVHLNEGNPLINLEQFLYKNYIEK